MKAYFIRRLLLVPPTLVGITLVVFLIMRLAPGSPIEKEMQAAMAAGGAEEVVPHRKRDRELLGLRKFSKLKKNLAMM